MYEIRATKLEKPSGNVVGLASMAVDDKFAFNSIRIIKNSDVEKGFYVSMPGYKSKSGEHIDFFHPATDEMRRAVYEAVLLAYETGQNVNIGNEETEISTYVIDVHEFGEVRANIMVVCDKDFVCNTISLREDLRLGEEENLYVAMPHYYTKEGIYKTYVGTISRDFYKEFESDVMRKYEFSVEKAAERQKTDKTPEENKGISAVADKIDPKPASR